MTRSEELRQEARLAYRLAYSGFFDPDHTASLYRIAYAKLERAWAQYVQELNNQPEL